MTPSDFPLLKLIQPEIDTLAVEYPSIEDILPLSPLQEGMLFRNILDSEGPDNYTVQLVLDLAGPLDPAALREAGNALFRRHANFRAGFYHKGDVQPVQVIQKQVFPAWRDVDLTAVSGAERALSQEKLLAAERAQRVDLAAALDALPARQARGRSAPFCDDQSPYSPRWLVPAYRVGRIPHPIRAERAAQIEATVQGLSRLDRPAGS